MLTTKQLLKIRQNLLDGLLNVIDMGDAALHSDNPKKCPPSIAFDLNLILLETIEKELKFRGVELEPDFVDEIAAIKAQALLDNDRSGV